MPDPHLAVDGPKTGLCVRFSAHQHRAVGELGRVAAPCRVANAGRNAEAGFGRRRRWGTARDALWGFLAPHLEDGARVAIVGAGNGDDLPLRRIARRAGAVTLIDIDPVAVRGARRRLGWAGRRPIEMIGHDITAGAADAIVLAARRAAADGRLDVTTLGGAGPDVQPAGNATDPPRRAPAPLPGAPYDLVLGDLLYSQLLYPALVDLEVEVEHRAAVLTREAPALTVAVVARLHASAPLVVHLHDPLAWWDGHPQPVALGEILEVAGRAGIDAALELVARGIGPRESDPRPALQVLGLTPTATALWRWPFAPGVDYLACATLAAKS
jgi:hypothetical protein